MPYFLHAKIDTPDTGTTYAARGEAYAALTDRATQTITFVCSDDERTIWMRREQERFYAWVPGKQYQSVPWIEEYASWVSDDMRNHFAHISTEQKDMVAYTPDDEHGVQDRQIKITPARYLERFARPLIEAHYRAQFTAEGARYCYWTNAYISITTEDRITNWIADQKAANRNFACDPTLDAVVKYRATADIADYVSQIKALSAGLQFAHTSKEILGVYLAPNAPESCMAHPIEDYQSFPHHPTEVYADSDLAIAYVGVLNARISARCVVWPEKKIYGRAYGDENLIARLLKAEGYTYGSMRGAHVRYLESDNGALVMPYIDNVSRGEVVRRNGRTWVRLGYGGMEVQNTSGICNQPTCPNCDSPVDSDGAYCEDCYQECAHCETQVDPDDRLCSRCDRNSFTCDSCSEEYFTRSGNLAESELNRMPDGSTVCDGCESDAQHTCAVCDDTHYPQYETHDHCDDICEACASTHDRCDTCDAFVESDTLIAGECIDCVPPEDRPMIVDLSDLTTCAVFNPVHDESVPPMVRIKIQANPACDVLAEPIGPYFAIHPTLGVREHHWTVTHTLSGLRVQAGFKSASDARYAAARFAALPVDWAFTTYEESARTRPLAMPLYRELAETYIAG